MKAAYREAKRALLIDEVPIGAVIVRAGQIIARGHNKREKNNDPTAHAEIIAIKKAAKKLGSWRLTDCTIYVTIEPCAMCAGAIVLARIDTVIYGAPDPKGGALGSSFNLYEQSRLNHYPTVVHDILKEECSKIISEYFKTKRLQK